MSWLQRNRLRSFLAGSLWLVPFAAIALALPATRIVYVIDRATRWTLFGLEPQGASAVVGTLSGTMLTFVVFVFSFAMLTVQIASSQLSPRIIAFAFRSRNVRLCLGLFVFSMIFALGTAGRVGERVPQLMVLVAMLLSVASIAAFLYLADNLIRHLRPVAVATSFGDLGAAVIEDVYREPLPLEESPPQVPPDAAASAGRVVSMAVRSSVLLAFDRDGLLAIASRANALIEIVPQVGDFVPHGEPLFRVHELGARLDDEELLQSVAFGLERTLEQDPLFAFRILVDIAEKALSPAINDPTTAVLVLDQLHVLLRLVGRRRLASTWIADEKGVLRLRHCTPNWEDFVALAVTEIRHFGATSMQVVRRLRVMLEDLIATLPQRRVPALAIELRLLDAAVARTFADPDDRERAAVGDYQGMGSPREAK